MPRPIAKAMMVMDARMQMTNVIRWGDDRLGEVFAGSKSASAVDVAAIEIRRSKIPVGYKEQNLFASTNARNGTNRVEKIG